MRTKIPSRRPRGRMAVSPRPHPLSGRPALAVPPRGRRAGIVVIADLHLGLGATGPAHRGVPGSSAEELAFSAIDAARDARARRLVVAGDVKHSIVGTPRPVRSVIFDFFSTLLQESLEVDVVLGNHDVGLAPHLPAEVRVVPAEGFALDGLGVFHGHRWPRRSVLDSPTMVTGHLHPGFRLAPTLDRSRTKEPCWLRVEYPSGTGPIPPRRRSPSPKASELIVLPPFNPLCGLESLNVSRPARSRSFLWHRFVAPGRPRLYLLDGTDVGPPVARAMPEASRAPR